VTCERCHAAAAEVLCIDEPEQEGALHFGDQTLGILLCMHCCRQAEDDGPWDAVVALDTLDALPAAA